MSRTKGFLAALLALLLCAQPALSACPVTWNPADKNAGITLTGGNLTATQGAINAAVRGNTTFPASAKVYFEEAVGAQNANQFIGFGNASMSLTNFPGFDNNAVGYQSSGGNILLNSAVLLGIQAYTTGDNVGTAIDFLNKKIWYRKNGGNWNNDVIANQNPATNTGGVSFSTMAAGPYFAAWGANNTNAQTANFGAMAFTYTAPAGFSSPTTLSCATGGLLFMGPF